MSISHYIKEIGRGKEGARSLNREQAADLFGQILDGAVSDLEMGAFCVAMRIKGESPIEMAGFLDATQARLNLLGAEQGPAVVIPSYNGARKLPVLTPLLSLLLARAGVTVLVHGTATESSRVHAADVFDLLGVSRVDGLRPLPAAGVSFVSTATLCPGLQRLLDVRRVVGLRNSGHSLVKLMNPMKTSSLLVTSYTHPEYAVSMAEVLSLMETSAILLRGTEGEPVADARRMPRMEAFFQGNQTTIEVGQSGSLHALPELPRQHDAVSTASYIRQVLNGTQAVPAPIQRQMEHILLLLRKMNDSANDQP